MLESTLLHTSAFLPHQLDAPFACQVVTDHNRQNPLAEPSMAPYRPSTQRKPGQHVRYLLPWGRTRTSSANICTSASVSTGSNTQQGYPMTASLQAFPQTHCLHPQVCRNCSCSNTSPTASPHCQALVMVATL
uniref:Uncharacterized protein n=1 Tax=Arundo donax TaxID=35708 RepID=A0A0A9E9T3_ARUDO